LAKQDSPWAQRVARVTLPMPVTLRTAGDAPSNPLPTDSMLAYSWQKKITPRTKPFALSAPMLIASRASHIMPKQAKPGADVGPTIQTLSHKEMSPAHKRTHTRSQITVWLREARMAGSADRRGKAMIAAACLALIGTLTACGTPGYTYVKNSGDKLYFKVPAEWSRIDQGALDGEQFADPDSATAEVQKALNWSVAYDADDSPSPRHIFGPRAAEPVVYARVQRLPPDDRGTVSFDSMRDLLLPVTTTARQTALQQGVQLTGFELLADEVINPEDGLRGVHSVFNYNVSGTLQTFDQTVLANDDASKVYLLLVRCSAKCYRERTDEIKPITKSMTVKA
jgi:hypothetical protein